MAPQELPVFLTHISPVCNYRYTLSPVLLPIGTFILPALIRLFSPLFECVIEYWIRSAQSFDLDVLQEVWLAIAGKPITSIAELRNRQNHSSTYVWSRPSPPINVWLVKGKKSTKSFLKIKRKVNQKRKRVGLCTTVVVMLNGWRSTGTSGDIKKGLVTKKTLSRHKESVSQRFYKKGSRPFHEKGCWFILFPYFLGLMISFCWRMFIQAPVLSAIRDESDGSIRVTLIHVKWLSGEVSLVMLGKMQSQEEQVALITSLSPQTRSSMPWPAFQLFRPIFAYFCFSSFILSSVTGKAW